MRPKKASILNAINWLWCKTSVMMLCITIVGLLYSNQSLAVDNPDSATQQATAKPITGTVVDKDNKPLAGVAVIIKGTSRGTVTETTGKFSIKASAKSVLLFSLIGYKPLEIAVDSRTNYMVTLGDDNQLIDDIVVTGYGTQKKINVTGAVDVIKDDAFKDRSATSTSALLQGQVPGLTGFETGANGFEPGASMSFNIRGQGSAYVLIDGVEGDMNKLNPADIESISVLKDAAAAAIYGARAAYGVVLITTKSGATGKPKVSFNGQMSAVKAHRMPEMVDSYTYVRAINEAGINGGAAQPYKDDLVNRIIAFQKDPSLPETFAQNNGLWASGNANHDWYDEYFGGVGFRDQENLQVSGGTKATKYYMSFGHMRDGGILQYGTDTYERINFTSKLDTKLTDWLSVSSNTYYSRSTREKPTYDNQGDYELLMHQIARTPPFQAMKTPNGYYTIQSKIPWSRDAGTETNLSNIFTQRFATQIDFTKDWKLNADISLRHEGWEWNSNEFTVYEDKVDGTLVPSGSTFPSSIGKSQNSKTYLSTNIYTTYNKTFKEVHNFLVMVGTQYENSQDNKIEGTKLSLISEGVPSFGTATGSITLGDAMSHWSTAGAFARVGYNYKEKYLFEANMRADGTSKFAEGNRWGIFPSFSLGWNISKENFFKRASKKIDMLKLRASWGQLGNQNVSAYQDLPLMGTDSNLDWIINGKRPDYTKAPNLINRELTWETSETMNVGVDLAAFGNRLTFSGDIYQRMTRDRLGPAEALPNTIGATLPKANNSTMRTRGWELSLGWKQQFSSGLRYHANIMISDYQNEITEFNNPNGNLSTDYVGKKTGEYWGYVTDGFILTQEDADRITKSGLQKQFYGGKWEVGDIRYKDIDGVEGITSGDNTLSNPGDRKIIGNSTPRYQFGINMGLEYKGIDFSMLWTGIAKRDLVLTGNMFWGFANSGQESLFPEHMDYFRDKDAVERDGTIYSGLGKNTDPYFPKPYRTKALNDKNQQTQTGYMQNGAYIKLKNIQVGYTLPNKWMQKINFQRIRIFFSGENLWTITGKNFHSPLDPETAYKGIKGNGKSYFSQAVYSFGLDIQF